jgi:integrase
MAIFEYEENQKKMWRFYLQMRSKIKPQIRLQRRGAGYSSKKLAEEAERRQFVQIVSEVTRLESVGSTWGDVVERWEAFHELYPTQKYALTTIRDHVALLKNWTKPWLKKCASELNRGDGRALLSQVLQLGKSGGFQKRLKNTINVIYTWGIDEGIISNVKHSPVYGIDVSFRKQDPLPEILTLEQVQKLLREAVERRHAWAPIWTVTVLTGCRNGEVLGLRKEDIDLVSEEDAIKQMNLRPENRSFGLIRLTRAWNSRFKTHGPLKGRYWRNVPVSSELYWVLKKLMSVDYGNDQHGSFLLPRFSEWKEGEQAKVLRMFCTEIGIPSVRFHTLRACFATHLISKGVPSSTVMKICGWRELKTAERYIRLAGIDERGATEGLGFVPSEQGALEKVVSLYDFRAKRANDE